MGRTRGDHGSVALEQRLQGCPASPTVPGGAAPGLHSRVLPQATGGFQLTWQSEKWLELSLTRRAVALLLTVLRRCSAVAAADIARICIEIEERNARRPITSCSWVAALSTDVCHF